LGAEDRYVFEAGGIQIVSAIRSEANIIESHYSNRTLEQVSTSTHPTSVPHFVFPHDLPLFLLQSRFRSRQHLRQWRSARRVLRVHRLLRTVVVVRMLYPSLYDAVRARAATSARTKPYESYHGLCMLVVLSTQPVVSKSQLGVVAATAAAKLTAAAATAVVNTLRRSLLIYSLLVLLVQ
jgi:hypothetical protein